MNQLPEITAIREVGERLHIDLRIVEGLGCLRGHFPGMPIVPGVAQVQWAVHFGSQRWQRLAQFRALHKLKFQNPILPGMNVCLELSAQGDVLSFRYCDADTDYSSGRILFAPS